MLNATDDTGLQELNWKRIVGGYLVRAKYLTVDWLKEKTEISGTADLDELQGQILKAAEATGVQRIPAYQPPSKVLLVRSVVDIGVSLSQLQPNDRAAFETLGDDRVEFNQDRSGANLRYRLIKETEGCSSEQEVEFGSWFISLI